MAKPVHILVFRFSAFGDVAMTVPVIREVLKQNPEVIITYVSPGFAEPLFAGLERFQFFAADLKGRHKGVRGLYILYKDLRSEFKIDAIADLHNVLRTKLLRGYFLFSGIKKSVIDKGRKEKAELTRINHKMLRPLKSTFQRYADVFMELGLQVKINPEHAGSDIHHRIKDSANDYYIGIAPFARHKEKTYPPPLMEQVIALLSKDEKNSIFLFGGKQESALLEEWSKRYPRVNSLAGKLNFSEELEKMSELNVMVSMDSANMHFASLVNVPVVSVWGSTHPYAGFYGWKQEPQNAVQVDLYCRPCSVFGNRECYRGDLACLHSINPVMVYDRICQVLFKNEKPQQELR